MKRHCTYSYSCQASHTACTLISTYKHTNKGSVDPLRVGSVQQMQFPGLLLMLQSACYDLWCKLIEINLTDICNLYCNCDFLVLPHSIANQCFEFKHQGVNEAAAMFFPFGKNLQPISDQPAEPVTRTICPSFPRNVSNGIFTYMRYSRNGTYLWPISTSMCKSLLVQANLFHIALGGYGPVCSK